MVPSAVTGRCLARQEVAPQHVDAEAGSALGEVMTESPAVPGATRARVLWARILRSTARISCVRNQCVAQLANGGRAS